MQPFLDWAQAQNVPLYVGEFGAMSTAPGDSRYNLIADKISLMNAAGLHWSLWTYRDPSRPGFGLYFGSDLDTRLAEILRRGLESARTSSPSAPASSEAAAPAPPLSDPLPAATEWWQPSPGLTWQIQSLQRAKRSLPSSTPIWE
jgi:hypothetical protein